MRIGMLSKFPSEQDGIAIYTESLCMHLELQGVEVVRIGLNTQYPIKFSSLFIKEALNKIIEKERLDLLHIQYIAPYYGKKTLNLGLIRALKLKIPVVVTLHEVQQDTKRGLKDRILKRIEHAVIKRASRVIVHTKSQASFIKSAYGKHAQCIYMGVEVKRNARKSRNLLFFGLISPGKGVDLLLETMRLLPEFNLTVAGRLGDGVPQEYLEKIKRLADLGNVTTEFEWISDIKKDELFKNNAILVLPYRWAPYQSAVLHDGVSYGLPIVATRVGGIWEVVHDFGMGVVVDPDDAKQLAKGIKTTFLKYETYRRGIEEYRRAANWEAMAKNTIAVYQQVIPS